MYVVHSAVHIFSYWSDGIVWPVEKNVQLLSSFEGKRVVWVTAAFLRPLWWRKLVLLASTSASNCCFCLLWKKKKLWALAWLFENVVFSAWKISHNGQYWLTGRDKITGSEVTMDKVIWSVMACVLFRFDLLNISINIQHQTIQVQNYCLLPP